MRNLSITLLFLLSSFAVFAQTKTFNVKDYGAKGNGVSDDYTAILSAIDALNKNKSGILYFPAGNYYIQPYHSKNTNYRNFEFTNLNNVEIQGNNAKITMNADFIRKADWSKGKYSYSYNSHLTFSFQNVNNLKISNLEIDGGGAKTIRQGNIAEQKGRILSFNNCNQVTLSNLHIHHALTDGIYITGQSNNFTGYNLLVENNARQAMSIIQLVGGHFSNSTFARSGRTGSYGGHSPMSGVDIEPTLANPGVRNIVFDNCNFIDNAGSQIVITAPSKTSNIIVKNSTIDAVSSNSSYFMILAGDDIRIENNNIHTGSGNIYPLWAKYKNSNVSLTGNNIKSDSRAFIIQDKSNTNKVYIKNNRIEYTGKTAITSYFPYITSASEYSDNTVVIPSKYQKVKGESSLLKNIKLQKNNKVVDEKNKVILQSKPKRK